MKRTSLSPARSALYGRVVAAGMLVTASCGIVDRARACNVCREDKIAATYDWEVVSTSQRQGHTVVFTAISGSVRPGDGALGGAINRTVGSVRGVDAGIYPVHSRRVLQCHAGCLRLH